MKRRGWEIEDIYYPDKSKFIWLYTFYYWRWAGDGGGFPKKLYRIFKSSAWSTHKYRKTDPGMCIIHGIHPSSRRHLPSRESYYSWWKLCTEVPPHNYQNNLYNNISKWGKSPSQHKSISLVILVIEICINQCVIGHLDLSKTINSFSQKLLHWVRQRCYVNVVINGDFIIVTMVTTHRVANDVCFVCSLRMTHLQTNTQSSELHTQRSAYNY